MILKQKMIMNKMISIIKVKMKIIKIISNLKFSINKNYNRQIITELIRKIKINKKKQMI